VFAGSLKQSVDDSVGSVVNGDLVIAASQFGGGGLSPGIVEAVDAVPEVDHAVGVATGPVSIDNRTRQVTVLDPASSAGAIEPEPVAGVVADLQPSQIAVGESLADDNDWTIGTTVTVRFTDGETEQLEVGAIYAPTTTLQQLIIPRQTWDSHQVQTVDNLVVISAADGVDVESARTAIEDATASFAPGDVLTADEYVAEATSRVDTMLGLIYAMLALAIIIALMGIANTLSLSTHERVRELGLLRAVGADRAQVRSMVRWESVVIAVFGTIGGLGLGMLLGWGLVRAADRGDFPITFAVPATQLVVVVVLGALAGVVAAWRPARRAARLDVLNAIAV
jgi:putative ABC transport system permease protein